MALQRLTAKNLDQVPMINFWLYCFHVSNNKILNSCHCTYQAFELLKYNIQRKQSMDSVVIRGDIQIATIILFLNQRIYCGYTLWKQLDETLPIVV